MLPLGPGRDASRDVCGALLQQVPSHDLCLLVDFGAAGAENPPRPRPRQGLVGCVLVLGSLHHEGVCSAVLRDWPCV